MSSLNGRYPFDIQHRKIISCQTESTRGFDQLKEKIKGRIESLMTRSKLLRKLAESDPIAPREGFSQSEIAVLATLAGEAIIPGSAISVYSLKRDIERVGFTALGFGLGFRRLLKKGLIESIEEIDDQHN
jgi:hypothetical protein